MRRRSLVLVALLAFAPGCAAPSAVSPSAGVAPSPSTWAGDEAEIRGRITASAEAWNRGDLQGHVAIYTDSVTFMTRNGPRPGVAPIVEAFTKTYFRDGQPKQQLRFEQLTVRPLGRDAALANARFVLSGGGEPDQTGWFTLVWVRTAEGWRAVHDHSS